MFKPPCVPPPFPGDVRMRNDGDNGSGLNIEVSRSRSSLASDG